MTTMTMNEREIRTDFATLKRAEPAIVRLLDARGLPPKAKYHVAKLLRLVRQETSHFDKERNLLIVKHGERRDATPEEKVEFKEETVTSVPPEKLADYAAELNLLLETDVSIAWGRIPIEFLDAASELSGEDWSALEPLVLAESEVAL